MRVRTASLVLLVTVPLCSVVLGAALLTAG